MFFRHRFHPAPGGPFGCLLLLTLLLGVDPRPLQAQILNVENEVVKTTSLAGTVATLTGKAELWLGGSGDPLPGSTVHLNSPDSWLFLETVSASQAGTGYLGRIRVNGAPAVLDVNVRVSQHLKGSVIIPHGPMFAPLEVFEGACFTGRSRTLQLWEKYNDTSLGTLKSAVSSFRLRRGYMATVAANENGSGASRTYVAQDGDVEVPVLPPNLNNRIRFIRLFPWRWVGKKGFGGTIGQNLKPDWYYNWNLDRNSTPDLEYVPIRQTRWWPGLDQDWKARGSLHLLGFNEPDRPDQANMTVGDAIAAWPELMATGLRLGAPAVSDGGLNWLYSFIDQADATGLRVDFVPVHYYRSYANPADPAGAAAQYYNFLKGVFERTKRPLWVTEFNNGADWTSDPDPTWAQQQATLASMIDMLDNAHFVERYAIFNWVEDVRRVVWDDGWPTDAGNTYRDNTTPLGFLQELPDSGLAASAHYLFDGAAADASGNGHDALLAGAPEYAAGRSGQALQFDGTASYAVLPAQLGDSTDFTFAAWVRWNGGSNWQRILDLGDGRDRHLFLTPKSGDGTLRFTLKNGGGEQRLNTTALTANVWTHVAVSLSGDTGKLFVNGALRDTNTAMTINPGDLGTRLNYLGKSQFPDPLFGGAMDDVRILNAALTDAQISTLVSASLPRFEAAVLPQPPAVALQPWTGSLAGSATGGTGTRSFSKLGGPGWLGVASDGRLTGVPSLADAGPNEFEVRVSVPSGGAATARVTVEVAPLTGLSARYAFNGNAAAACGTLPAQPAGAPAYVPGRQGQAVSLDGTDDYLTLPASLAQGSTLTFAAWIHWTASAAWQRIFDFGNGTAEHFFLTTRSNANRMALTIRKGTVSHTIDAPMVPLGTWTHVAVTFGPGTMRLYVNGNIVASGTTTLVPSDIRPGNNFLGKSQYADPLFNGRMDEVIVFQEELDGSRIAALMAGQAPVFAADPLSRPQAPVGQVYEQSLAGSAADPDAGDTLTWSRISGPRWLTVDGYGRISGVPGAADAGLNRFVVRATDASGLASEAVLHVTVPVPQDLLAHYRFDGSLANHLGVSAGTATGSPVWEAGMFDRALGFDGMDDAVTLPFNLLNAVTDATFAVRVRWDGGSNWQRIFDFGNSTTQFLMLTPCSGSGTLRFATLNGSGSEQMLQTTPLVDGDWAHVAVTLTGNTGTLYLNGAAAASGTITVDPAALLPSRNYLGDSQFAADPLFHGAIDDLRIYSRGLNAAEVAALAIPADPVVVPDFTFGGWAQGLPFPPGQAGPVQDPDNDGVPNLMEYLMGSDPLQGGPASLPEAGIRSAAELGAGAVPGKSYLALQARVRRHRSGVVLAAEAAPSPEGFVTPMPAIQAGPPLVEGEFERFTWFYPAALEESSAGPGFLRLKVSTQP